MKRSIYLDCDGSFIDLYGVPNWLEYLTAEDPIPYEIAKPLVNLSLLARYLNKVQKQGYRIGVISWCSKNASTEYDRAVEQAKRQWLAKHLPSVNWDEIIIVPYGTPKENYKRSETDVLFDDESRNVRAWGKNGYPETAIFEVLKQLVKEGE